MVDHKDHESLEAARRRSGLSVEGLWIRYFEIGGMASVLELDAFLQGALAPERIERDMVAHVLNEAFADQGVPDRLTYLYDEDARPGHWAAS